MGEHVAQLPPLMDGARGFWCAVATDVAREGKLFEEAAHARFILRLIRIDLGVGAIEVGGAQHTRRPMARPREVDHVELTLADQPVGMGPDEGLARARAPMTQQAVLDVLGPQGFAQQGVVLQIDHSHRQVVGGAPPGINLIQLFTRQRCNCVGLAQGHGADAFQALGGT